MDDPDVVLEVHVVIAHNGIAVVASVELLVALQPVTRERVSNQVLLANDDEFARCGCVPFVEDMTAAMKVPI